MAISGAVPHKRKELCKLRALAVTSTTRSEALPDLPTIGDFLPRRGSHMRSSRTRYNHPEDTYSTKPRVAGHLKFISMREAVMAAGTKVD
jgi:hypothetical protein